MSDSTPAPGSETPVTPVVKQEFPGQTLGIVALVLAFFMQLPALVMGIIAWNWSNRAGVSNTPAKASVFVSIGLMVLGIIVLVGWLVALASLGEFLDEAMFEFNGPRMRP